MGTLTSTTAQRSTPWGNQHKEATTSLGVRWAAAAQAANSSPTHVIGYSTDNGATWNTTALATPSGQAGQYTPDSDLFADANNRLHHVLTDTGTGWMYYRWASLDSTHTVPTWSTWTRLDANESHSAPSLTVHPDPAVTGAVYVHVVASYVTYSTTNSMRYRRGYLTAAGSMAWDSGFITIGGSYDAQVDVFPSIDFRHTGDGKTVAGGQPDLFVSWTAGRAGTGYGVRFRKATYSTPGGTGTWTFGAEVSVDTAHFVAGSANVNKIDSNSWVSSFWDGARVVISGLMSTGNGLDLLLHDVNPDTSAVTQRTLGAQTAGNAFDLGWGTATYDAAGNVFLFGTESSSASGSRVLGHRKWTRSGAALAARVTLASAGGPTPWVSVSRGGPNSRIGWLSTQGASNPFTVTTGQVVLNYPPNAATPTTPTTGSTVDRTTPITLAWIFNDPDAGDGQSKADIRYRLTSASTWTMILGATTTTTSYALPANQAAGDYEWQVLTYDSLGVASPWSSSSFFTAGTPPTTPTITAPSTGATVGTATFTVTWSAPAQDAYEVRRVADSGGSPVTGTAYFTTGTVEDASGRARTLTFDTNQRTEHVQVRVRSATIWSQWASARVLVSYTPPPTPVVQLLVRSDIAALEVRVTNPTSAGSQPTVASNSIDVDDGYGEGFTPRSSTVAVNGAWVYDFPRINYDYEQKVRVTAVGANGTSSSALAPVTP